MTRLDLAVGRIPLWMLGGMAAVCLVLAGCVTTGQHHRGKAAEESEASRYDLSTVGDKTAVANAEPLPLGGVGLVEGLEGTGGDCPHDSYRAMLADQLRKEGVQNVKELLASPDRAVVIVEAAVTPGGAKGDRIDVVVKLPPGSRATSLRGGVLRKTPLYNYDFARNLRPDYNGPQNSLRGHRLAEASGAVLVADGEDGSVSAKQGRIWRGARALADQPLALIMNPDSQQARFTSIISDRINATFQPGLKTGYEVRVANTSDNKVVALRVPPQYKHNLPRYLRVVRVLPLADSFDFAPTQGDDKRTYRQRLAEDLLDPARTLVAALRLEALGQGSLPSLKAGLKSEHPLVRLCSAEALAYLGSSAGCEELGRCAVKYPIVRAYALSALAALDESASAQELRKLIASDVDDECRCGAYRALQLLDERDPMVRGERIAETFALHVVPTQGRPMVHLSTADRPEVVLFGKPTLKGPLPVVAGEYAVTATAESVTATISYVSRDGRKYHKTCGLEVEEVVKCMADMGASYAEVLAALLQASGCGAADCAVRVDATPRPPGAHELADLGRSDPTGQLLLPAGRQR